MIEFEKKNTGKDLSTGNQQFKKLGETKFSL